MPMTENICSINRLVISSHKLTCVTPYGQIRGEKVKYKLYKTDCSALKNLECVWLYQFEFDFNMDIFGLCLIYTIVYDCKCCGKEQIASFLGK